MVEVEWGHWTDGAFPDEVSGLTGPPLRELGPCPVEERQACVLFASC